MKPLLTRQLAYLVALAVLINMGVLTFLVVQSMNASNELKQALALDQAAQKARSAHTSQIIDALKQQSTTQTAYIKCLADLARSDGPGLTIANIDNCDIVADGGSLAGEPSPTSPYRTLPQTTQAVPATKTAVHTTPSPSASPTASKPATGQKSVLQSIIKTISGLL